MTSSGYNEQRFGASARQREPIFADVEHEVVDERKAGASSSAQSRRIPPRPSAPSVNALNSIHPCHAIILAAQNHIYNNIL